MYPISVKVDEAQFAQPLLSKFKKEKDCPFWVGKNMLKELPMYMNSLFQSYHDTDFSDPVDATVYGLDFSKFDSSLPAWLIELGFDVLEACIDFESPISKKHAEVKPSRYEIIKRRKSWEFIRRYFVKTPILFQDGCLYLKSRGVPSGSYFTSMIDSVCNEIMTKYSSLALYPSPCLYLKNEVKNQVKQKLIGEIWVNPLADKSLGRKLIFPRRFKACGDDNAFSLPSKIMVKGEVISAPTGEEFAEFMNTRFGPKVNGDKSIVTQTPSEFHFLGHGYRCGRTTRPTEDDLFKSMLFPERMVGGVRKSVARSIGILMDSALSHAKFYHFTKSHIAFCQLNPAFYEIEEGHGTKTDIWSIGMPEEKKRRLKRVLDYSDKQFEDLKFNQSFLRQIFVLS